MVEFPGFFSLYCDEDGAVLFKGWYFEDSKELLSMNLNISGVLCFAYSEENADTQPISNMKYLQFENCANVNDCLRDMNVSQEANILLVRQEDKEDMRTTLYNKIVNQKLQ